jgi:LPS-assembly lipoprotein
MWSFSVRSLTSFPRTRESRVLGRTPLGLRLVVPRNFALRARFRGDDGSARQSPNLGPGLRRDDDCAFRSAVARLGVGLVLSGALVACGFHLRGEAHYTFDTLFLNSPAAQPLTTDLKRSLEGIGTARLVPSPETAQVILDISSVENNKQILSLSGGGKVREFLLTKRVLFRVRDSAGNDWLPTSEVLVRRSYTYNDTEALAREAQEQRLWREMQDDAVAQIVRRLQQAKKPA